MNWGRAGSRYRLADKRALPLPREVAPASDRIYEEVRAAAGPEASRLHPVLWK